MLFISIVKKIKYRLLRYTFALFRNFGSVFARNKKPSQYYSSNKSLLRKKNRK